MDNPFNLNQPLAQITFAVLDVETTGLDPAYGHRVCEVGCLRARDGQVLERFESLVDPGRDISPGAFRVNRITPEMLRGAPKFDAIADRLLRRMENAVLVAHNAPFDLGFLTAELEIARRPLPDNPGVDTLALARNQYRFYRNSLSAVAGALEVQTHATTHRAMSDVETTYGVLKRMMEELASQHSITTLGELIDLQGGPVQQRRSRTLVLPPAIAEALERGGRVRMRYVDSRGRETDRVVRPLRVSQRQGTLYLIAHCYARNAQRTFRLDRVVEMVLER
jgi:DNA polymerase-3 subunit epsilon